MNIFFLDRNPKTCAEMHCDKHVIKMILESAQMICTNVNYMVHNSIETPYRSTHINHPCTVWARQSKENLNWLYELMLCLNDEYKFRYNQSKNHKSVDALKLCNVKDVIDSLRYPDTGFTTPALAMPDYCKLYDDPAECYKLYYLLEKRDILNYTKRSKPYWVIT